MHNLGLGYILSKLRLLWARITFSRLTIFYFTFSVVHCLVQISLQLRAFTINAQAATFLADIVSQSDHPTKGFPVLVPDGLRICDFVPSTLNAGGCTLEWDGTVYTNNTIGASSALDNVMNSPVSSSESIPSPPPSFPPLTSLSVSTAEPSSTSTLTVTTTTTEVVLPTPIVLTPAAGNSDDSIESDQSLHARDPTPAVHEQITLNGYNWHNVVADLDDSCLWALTFPLQVLDNTKREDIVFVAFQFWVLGMSIVALLNESIPHILASLLTHMLATSWAAYQISHTATFSAEFSRVITHGACGSVDLLPNYWIQRRNTAEIPILILNVVSLFVSGILTWRLIKLFGWQTFKRVGASMTINRVYKFVLTLSITIQLSLFFMVATVGLWIDQLFNGDIGRLATEKELYKGTFIPTLILLVPWLMTGWFAIRRELRFPMLIFLLLCVTYMAGWALMFVSTSFRWTFVQWQFFAIMATASVLLTLAALILGIICRINFGKGLLRYLQAQELLENDDSASVAEDDEKFAFPSKDIGIPTFSVTFGSGSEVPPPSQMNFGPSRPAKSATTQKPTSNSPSLAMPPNTANGRRQGRQLTPNSSVSSKGSRDDGSLNGRTNSHSSSQSGGSLRAGNAKRWLIE